VTRDCPVPIALVGCGYWGVNYIRVLSELPGAVLAGICDADPDRVELVARRFHVDTTWKSVDDALATPAAEAVVVATPSATHAAVVARCLEAGKHVLVEKPLALSVADAESLVALARARGRRLMVAHTFMYNPAVQALKRYVRSAAFGQIYYVVARRTHLGLIRRDVNAVWDLAPHDVSIFTYLLDRLPVAVSAVGGRFIHADKEDVAFVALRYGDGVVGNIQVSWIDSNKVREVAVVGSRQRVVFDDVNHLEKIRIFEKGAAISGDVNSFGEFQLMLRDGDIISPKIEATEPLRNQCEHFVHCVRTGDEPLTGGGAGLDVVRVMVAIERSLAQGGVPVPVG
jgi:predicted dehydrogenase